MLSPLTKIAGKIMTRRKLRKLFRRDLANLIGCSQAYICQVETGRRTVSLAVAKKLEVALGAKSGAYRKAEFRRGRPPCSPETRSALRAISAARVATPRPLLHHGVPRHPRPDFQSTIGNPLWPIANFLGEESQQEVTRLEKLRPRDEHFWRKINGIGYQSWTEKRFQVRVGLAGAALVGVRPGRLGAVLPTACGQTGLDASRKAYPTFVFQDGDLSVAILPQRCVGTAVTYRWADSLVVAAIHGRKVTAVVETDGAAYHTDRAKDRRRDEELDVPVLRIDAGQVGEPGLIARMVTWLRTLLES